MVYENREYVRAIVEALSYTPCQTIAKRGQWEGLASNTGKLIELLQIGKLTKLWQIKYPVI